LAAVDLVTISLALAGIAAFLFGIYEFRIAQKWKKSEFAAKQLEKLTTDPKLVLCTLFLDWSPRKVPVPSAYRLMIKKTTFIHKWTTLAEAMRPEDEKERFTWEEVVYRDSFDYFFNYLEDINHFINIGLVSIRDVESLKYWVKEIAMPRFAEEMDRPQRSIFGDFLESYRYIGVFDLMKKFRINANRITKRD